MTNVRKIIVGSYYRPPNDTGYALDQLNTSLDRINKNSKATVILGGDFNLRHINWSTPSTTPGKPDIKSHEQLLDIMNDHSLEQMVPKPTRGDRTLDIIFTNSPGSVTKVETMPPIGNADYDIVYAEFSLALKRKKKPTRKIYKYNKANWVNMKNDIIKITENITSQYETATSDNLWKIFKEQLLNSMETNIPHKLTTGKKKLPWVGDQLRIKFNKAKHLHRKRKNSETQMKKYKHIKKIIQQDMRKAY